MVRVGVPTLVFIPLIFGGGGDPARGQEASLSPEESSDELKFELPGSPDGLKLPIVPTLVRTA